MNKEEELQDAYNKLDAAEMQISRMRKESIKRDRVEAILIAAGFLTQEKLNEAMDILYDLPDDS